MAVYKLPEKQEIPFLDFAEVHACLLNDKQASARQIADHLEEMIKTCGYGEARSLRIPSPVNLAAFYNRSVLDILDGLYELKLRHYVYITAGLDEEVILHDPMNRHAGGHTIRKSEAKCDNWPGFRRCIELLPAPIYPLKTKKEG